MMEVDLLGWLPRCGFAARSIVLADDVVTEILDEAERVFAPFVAPDGSVVFDLSAHIVSGTSG